jgi:hypothetical protein
VLVLKHLRRRPSPALAVSFIALLIALGGTSFAAFSVPKNSVGTKQLKNNAVTTKKVKNNAVTTKKIKNGAVTGSKLNLNGVTVPNATNATHATSADNATNATNATHATSADNATNATTATTAGTSVLQDVNPSTNNGTNNISLSTNSTAPTTINSLTLPGPGTYLIVANGAVFTEGPNGSDCDAAFEITVNGTPVSGNQTDTGGSLDAAGNYVESDYAIQRLLNITAASPTVGVVGFKFDGTQTCDTYDDVLTATHVGTASGAVAASRISAGRAGQGGPPVATR